MNPARFTPPRLRLLPLLLLAPILFSACETNEKRADMSEGATYMETHAVTFDNLGNPVKEPVATPALAVSPTSADVEAVGDTLVFKAEGGTPPYEWSVANLTIGVIQYKNGNPCVYVCKQLKQNSVFVTDHRGRVAVAAIGVTATP